VPLKSRITLLVLAAVTALCAVLAALLWWRDQELTTQYHESLLQGQRATWTKLQEQSLAALRDALDTVIAQEAWQRAWHMQDRQALGALLQQALARHPHWRADLFDARRALVSSTSTELRQDALVETGWVARALRDGEQSGVSQASRERYYLVSARAFGPDGERGVLAVGLDLARLLPELAGALAGDTFLLNVRGREVAGTRPGLLPAEGLAPAVRQPRVGTLPLPAGGAGLAIVQPLAGPDARRVGALLLVRDVTAQRAADRRAVATMAGGTLALILLLGLVVFAYLRRALRPLERSVQVLGALSRGDLRTALDDEDQALADEAGHIARGVETLRNELLNLQMLREERIRTRQQQERLIRRQLKLLAESLDEASRGEILAALGPERAPDSAGSGNELADLARILGRMSGLVTTQQDRLVGLLRELREAMERQAMLVGLQQELEIARNMQLSILPRQAPATAAVDVSALMIPAKEVGGDFYDYFLIDDERLALVVADVSGKGIPAAFFMAISRTLLKSNALFLREPAEVMARLNEQLCAENEQMMFVTAFLAVLHLRTGEVDYVNAGHNPPLLRHPDGSVDLLPSGQNTALAVMEGLRYTQGRIRLASGDTLLLYTDGITEATDAAGVLFTEGRLVAAVRAHQPEGGALPAAVLQAVRAFEAGAAQADDITCVAVRYVGTAGVAG
jgi:sigma-B regulation protein RsbU (phosphoserine phosphatase)